VKGGSQQKKVLSAKNTGGLLALPEGRPVWCGVVE